jgi:DNA invertase Pin-like site-specific DNA recombinase
MAMVGYIRVSTPDQNLYLQIDAMKAAGCKKVFEDFGRSALAKRRPGFEAALTRLNPGDTFLVWSTDRAFRDAREALNTLFMLQARGVKFHSMTDAAMDTATPTGKLLYQIRSAFAEFERNTISLRTKAGMAAHRRRGRKFGRPRKLDAQRIAWARNELRRKTMRQVARRLRVCPRTLSRALRLE